MARARPASSITESQEKFIEGKLLGLTDHAAARAAGQAHAGNLTKSATVKEQLAGARRWLTDVTQITRLDVIEGVIDGIEMARMQGDSGNVIKGWTEVGKILGHYAPEVKKVELSLDQGRLLAKFESMSDVELLSIVNQNNKEVIDGDCTTVE